MKIVSNPNPEWMRNYLLLIGLSGLIGICLFIWGLFQVGIVALLVSGIFDYFAYRYWGMLSKNKYTLNLSRSDLTIQSFIFNYTIPYGEIEEIEIEKEKKSLGENIILRLVSEDRQKEISLNALNRKERSFLLKKLRDKTHKRIHYIKNCGKK